MSVATGPDRPAQPSPMWTLRDVAAYLGVSQETARKLCRLPGFPLFHHARTFRIPQEAFLEWMAAAMGQNKEG